MSNFWINIRFGARHFQLGRNFNCVKLCVNPFFIENKPEKYFQVYDFFGLGSNDAD